MIHLDTSFLIRALVQGSPEDSQLRQWLRGHETLAISSVSWTELLCGPIDRAHVDIARRVVTNIAPYVEEDAAQAAELFNDTGRRRGSMVDCMIAATALRGKASLATANAADFRRFEKAGLVLLPA